MMEAAMSSNTEIEKESQGATQYLTFMLDGEEYGVDILRVQEIKGWDKVTLVPNMPDYVKGIINLRGTIVPIIDLRLRFGLHSSEYGPTTVIIVVKVSTEGGEKTVGLVSDAVSEVYNMQPGAIKPPPDVGETLCAEFIKGLAMLEKKMVILLNIDAVIGEQISEEFKN